MSPRKEHFTDLCPPDIGAEAGADQPDYSALVAGKLAENQEFIYFFEDLPQTLDLSSLGVNLGYFLRGLVGTVPDEELLAKLPDTIDLNSLTLGACTFLDRLVDKGCQEEIIDRLPQDLEVTELDVLTRLLLRRLPNSSTARSLVDKITKPNDFSELNAGNLRYLAELAAEGSASVVLDKLPDTINFESLSREGGWLLQVLVRRGCGTQILEYVPDQVDLQRLRQEQGWPLAALTEKGFGPEILTRLPEIFDLNTMSKDAGKVLASLARKGLAHGLVRRLPADFDLRTISEGGGLILSELVRLRGWADQLPDELDLVNTSQGGGKFLGALAASRYDQMLTDKLPDKIELDQINEETGAFLRDLVNTYHEQAIMDRLPDQLQLGGIKSATVLASLARAGYERELLDRLPDKLDLTNLLPEETLFLETLVRSGYSMWLLLKLPEPGQLKDVSEAAGNFLWRLFTESRDKSLIKSMLEELEPELRRPISPDQIDDEYLDEEVDIGLPELIDGFPIEMGSKQELRQGWQRAAIKKTGSKTYVYFKPESDGMFKLVFANDEIEEMSLKGYREITKLIPEYVSSAEYFELDDEGRRPEPVFRRQGYREIYAGPSIRSIEIDELPPPIKASINAQISYISWVLAVHGIKHGHLHNGNLNVRFLLEGDEGKQVCFDVGRALRLAKEKEWMITPIVILRDWDLASG